MLLRYDCHTDHGQNTRSFFFPRPLGGGVLRCMLYKSPGTRATTADAV